MLTPEQQKWIDHLSDTDKVKIIPFDPTSEEKFQAVKKKIQAALGKNLKVEHHGASSMGISGQDEIDVYIPVPPDKFDPMVPKLTELFSAPRSLYPLERARFVIIEQGKHVDVFLINDACKGWTDCLIFEDYLKSHQEVLDEYRKLKEDGNGLSTREYYRRKTEFINMILAKAKG